MEYSSGVGVGLRQRDASKAIAELVELGYLEALPATDRRQRRIRLSDSGWKAIRFARRTRRLIEARLRKTAGASQYDEAKRIVLECLDALGGLERVRARRVRGPE
jgi:DNA-binding MarR family transcriptional regulator